MEKFRKYLSHILVLTLVLSCVSIWYVIYTKEHPSNILTVAFLDIGQGDSIYIEAPNGRQMLVDGGPSGPVLLNRLAKVMPYGDKSIDVLLATHADADHIGGLASAIDKFQVAHIFENGASSKTKTFQNLDNKISEHKIEKVIARKGMKIILDQEKGVYFDILFPDRDVSGFKETNDGSIVGKLVYGNECFMLTGDATIYTENLIMQTENYDNLNCQVIKLGHHGSHTSSSQLWLEHVHPDVAVISAGKNNRYGHPHKEVLDRLNFLHIPYLSTMDRGTIIFRTDGLKILN